VVLVPGPRSPLPKGLAAVGRAGFTLLATAAPLLFAGYAVGTESISPTAFAVVHLGTGAMTLALLVGRGRLRASMAAGTEFVRPLALAVHALLLASSLLFVDPARGAVALLGSIQLTQWILAVWRGPRPRPLAWLGSLAIVGGIVGLVLPTASPGLVLGTAFMSLAGFAWTGHARPDRDPEDAPARNANQHVVATVFAISLAVGMHKLFAFTPLGVALAATSGAISAGLRHAGWDRMGPRLGARSAFARLAVPTLMVLGASTILVAPIPLPAALSAALVLGGTALALVAKHGRAG
jgi:hypothetical protein